NNGICPQGGGRGRPIAAAILRQSAAGMLLPLMTGRVIFFPNSPDAWAWTPLSASLSNGTRFSTTWPSVACSALLLPFRAARSWPWANRFAVTHSFVNFGLARIFLTAACRYPLTPLLNGPARLPPFHRPAPTLAP